MPTKQQTKYRPSLTATQVRKIVFLARSETPISDDSISLISVLSVFLTKIENGSNKPAYITAPANPSILEVLEGTANNADYSKEDTATNVVRNLAIDPSLPKEVLWKACYDKYVLDPTSCSANEIMCSQEHKYLNDLMTAEEVTAFETQQFKDYNQ